MSELIKDRIKILSNWLPGYELKELKQSITERIDYINALVFLFLPWHIGLFFVAVFSKFSCINKTSEI